MNKKLYLAILSTYMLIVQPVFAGSKNLPNHIEYIAGGLMSAEVELRVDLESGTYTLAEPAPGTFFLGDPHSGKLSAQRLDHLRGLAAEIVTGGGFETSACLRAEKKEYQRRGNLQKRNHIIILDLPPMDGQLSFWVRMNGQVKTAPYSDTCWRDVAHTLYQDMFYAAHTDLEPEATTQLIHAAPVLDIH